MGVCGEAFSGASFAAFPNPGTLAGGGGSAPLYNWSISSYAPNGDVLGMTDAVMGSWSYSYDDFNRLSGGTANSGLGLGWTYDRYGNRWAQNASCSGSNCTGVTAAQPQLTFGNNRAFAWVRSPSWQRLASCRHLARVLHVVTDYRYAIVRWNMYYQGR